MHQNTCQTKGYIPDLSFSIYQIEIGQQTAENDASLRNDAELTCDGWDRDPAWPYIRKFPTVVFHYDLDSGLSKTYSIFGLGIKFDSDRFGSLKF